MAFLEKMKEYFDKGIEVSKDAITKASGAVQDFGDKSVVKIEIKQLESKLNKEYISLGNQVYNLYLQNKDEPLSYDNAYVSGVLAEITRLTQEIEARKNSLKETEEEKTEE
ncbi:MAG: hypothetical protein IKZ04_02695 [Spirochaetaceae bacterium]|nr:hypothetical protein [Spirochaetaceae bacterium]